MGKLEELRNEYILCPSGTQREMEIKDEIRKITESEWWDVNVGKPFVWPVKQKKYNLLKYDKENGFYPYGNFIVPKNEICPKCRLWKSIIVSDNQDIPVVK